MPPNHKIEAGGGPCRRRCAPCAKPGVPELLHPLDRGLRGRLLMDDDVPPHAAHSVPATRMNGTSAAAKFFSSTQ